MRFATLILLGLTLLACPPQPGPGETGDDDDGGTPTPEGEAPRAFQDYSEGSCPNLTDGRNNFATGGTTAGVDLYLPDDPNGAPVVFMWHWLGGSAADIGSSFQANTMRDRRGAVVVIPDSFANFSNEWNFMDFQDPAAELTFFDDMLACLEEQFDIDERRVYTTGMSAGGLWSTKLLLERSDALAAAVIFSGGTGQGTTYAVPAYDTPVLLSWGGAADVWPSPQNVVIDFNAGMIELAQNLADDGHEVVECIHTLGHSVPGTGPQWLRSYLFEHEFGTGESAFADGDPTGDLADYCTY